MQHKRKILKGQVYGKRTIIEELEPVKHQRRFSYRCACGAVSVCWLSGIDKNYGCGCAKDIQKALKFRRKKSGEASFNEVYASYVRGAKARNLAWNLTKEHFLSLATKECFYCGALPAQIVHAGRFHGNFVHNGIDRLHSTKGYTPQNTVSCCKKCNFSKRSTNFETFKAWIQKVYENYAKA